MGIEEAGGDLARHRSQELVDQLNRIQEIMDSLTSTFEDIALLAGVHADGSAQAVAVAAIARARKTSC
ncbi:hypothetical protein HBDW_00370 [Herbaspirillum sp. DW155]|uniref:hypothetical protein n=1 Tax=Herbaspirillum sp. DW155 TaxID=3095609 RepID=UPI00308E27ED|nr:hypothetical protein HBDW_00370 [Herbaspirillum sp. DW155]